MNTNIIRRMSYRVSLFAATVFTVALLVPAAGAAELNRVDAAASRVDFTYKQMGVAMDGHFGKANFQLAFDPAKPETSSAAVEIDVTSVDAGSADATQEVASKPWFDAAHHPKAVFKSAKVKALGDNRYEANGTLTIKGRSREAVVPFTFVQQNGGGAFDAVLTIKRGDFGIGDGEWADYGIVANEIALKIHIQALQ